MAQKTPVQSGYLTGYLSQAKNFSELIQQLDLDSYYKSVKYQPRYQGFIQWVAKNDAQLFADLKKDIANGMLQLDLKSNLTPKFIVGFWLGGRYVASLYKTSEQQKFFAIKQASSEKDSSGALAFGAKSIGFSVPLIKKTDPCFFISTYSLEQLYKPRPSDAELFIVGFNVGIHEYTHALRFINQGKGELTELASFFTTSQHGLPLKADSKIVGPVASGGIRDFQNTLLARKLGNLSINADSMLMEYLAFAAGPWIKAYYKDKGKEPNLMELTAEGSTGPTLRDFYLKRKGSIIEVLFTGPSRTPKDMVDELGVKDAELRKKLFQAFKLLGEAKWDNAEELLQQFTNVMDKVFGNASSEYVPPGYVLYNQSDSKPGQSEKSGTRFADLGKIAPRRQA